MSTGYQRTGYSEPFITDVGITTGDSLRTLVVYTETNIAATTIDGAITIDKTEYKNSVTFGIVSTTLSVAAGNGTITPLVTTYNNFRIGDIFEDSVGYAYEIVDVDGNNITLNRDVVAEIPVNTSLLTKGRKLHLFELNATKDYVIGDKVLESVGGVGISPDPYPILPEILSGITIPDTTVITDAASTRSYFFNTSFFSAVVIDAITDKGTTIVLYPLPLEDDLTVLGKASDITTIVDGGAAERVLYSNLAAPNIKVVVTKTQAGDMASYVFSVHGIR